MSEFHIKLNSCFSTNDLTFAICFSLSLCLSPHWTGKWMCTDADRAQKHGMDEFISANPCNFDHGSLFELVQRLTLDHRLNDSYSCLVRKDFISTLLFQTCWGNNGKWVLEREIQTVPTLSPHTRAVTAWRCNDCWVIILEIHKKLQFT